MAINPLHFPGCLDLDEVLEAAKEQMFGMENPGFCIACGHRQEGCEPDAREYTCENCNKSAVYGAAELIAMHF